jgi:hypothetical protein
MNRLIEGALILRAPYTNETETNILGRALMHRDGSGSAGDEGMAAQ